MIKLSRAFLESNDWLKREREIIHTLMQPSANSFGLLIIIGKIILFVSIRNPSQLLNSQLPA